MREIEVPRDQTERCGNCGRRLTWIEVAFGRPFDPVCGRCLIERRERERTDATQTEGNR